MAGFGSRPKPGKTYDNAGQDRGTRKERDAARSPSGPSVWFHMDIGRRNNADPKWLLPLICRRGNVTRADIGAIRIFDRETKFEISEAMAQKFAASAKGIDADDITISLSTEAGGGDTPPRDYAKPKTKRPFVKAGAAGPGPGSARPGGDKAYAKPRRPKKPSA